MKKILKEVANNKCTSIVGLGKGVGKTSTLNYFIKNYRGRYVLGLTANGIEGEGERIYVEAGTFIATAKRALLQSDITKEIIESTNFNTPLGPIIIARAVSSGYVKLAGPSSNAALAFIRSRFELLGCRLVLIDGSLSRKAAAAADISTGVIIVTGASISPDMEQVAETTAHAVSLLTTERVEKSDLIDLYQEVLKESRLAFIYNNYIKNSGVETVIGSAQEIAENLSDNLRCIFIKGIVTDSLIDNIMKSTDQYKGKLFVVEDGTRLFLSHDVKYRFERSGGIFRVIKPINVIGISYNPAAQEGYVFNRNDFYAALKKKIKFTLFNIEDVKE